MRGEPVSLEFWADFTKGQSCVFHPPSQLNLPRQRKPRENLSIGRRVPGGASHLNSRFKRSVYVSLLPNSFTMTQSPCGPFSDLQLCFPKPYIRLAL